MGKHRYVEEFEDIQVVVCIDHGSMHPVRAYRTPGEAQEYVDEMNSFYDDRNYMMCTVMLYGDSELSEI